MKGLVEAVLAPAYGLASGSGNQASGETSPWVSLGAPSRVILKGTPGEHHHGQALVVQRGSDRAGLMAVDSPLRVRLLVQPHEQLLSATQRHKQHCGGSR